MFSVKIVKAVWQPFQFHRKRNAWETANMLMTAIDNHERYLPVCSP